MVMHDEIDHSSVVAAALSFGSNANSVSSVAGGGASTSVSRADHVHLGVPSISHASNTLSGPVTLVAEGSIGITKTNATTFAINSTGTGGAGSVDPAALAGYELDYVEKTTNTSITATTEATANTVVTGAAVAYDGSTIIEIEFYTPGLVPDAAAANRALSVDLYDGASAIGVMAYVQNQGITGGATFYMPLHGARRLTPSAATHTYSIRAHVSAGTGSVIGGAGGSGANMPCFMRITRVSS